MKNIKIINKKAYFDYFLIDKYEAGMVLLGKEIKLIRNNKFNIYKSYCKIYNNEIFIYNINIKKKKKRKIKLLLLKKEILKINQKIKNNNNLTIIPTKIFFSKSGYAKIEIFLSKKKKIYDKKKIIKKKEEKKINKYFF
ncbi:MAG: SsrA-binding protein [Candidatus Shikimatogenerans bostrichidophilus]|nr:MAG: SsrA-binding protein [Candidatus Shikimatogenerans bostrichidophilus]